MPAILANSVSSLPMPTFRPRLNLVPRWRTRIDPPLTSWPPKRFTPSRCEWLSRPFRELPTPFLCAIQNSWTSNRYLVDSNGYVILPMSVRSAILLLPLLFKYNDFLCAVMLDHRRFDCGIRYQRCTNLYIA